MLIIVCGLPATGKTTLSRLLARDLGAVHLRIDTIEQAIVRSGAAERPLGPVGYTVAHALAADQLRQGLAVVAECVNPLAGRGPQEQRPVRLLPGTPELERYRSSQLISFRSFAITVEFAEHRAGDQGVLVPHGDQGGGYSLYVERERLWLAYNQYGSLFTADLGPLAAGVRAVTPAATAVPGLRREFTATADGAPQGPSPALSVHQLIGMAPFQGFSIGPDRKSPVSWPLYQRHGPFRYSGRLTAVTYTPGDPAPDDRRAVERVLKEAAASFE